MTFKKSYFYKVTLLLLALFVSHQNCSEVSVSNLSNAWPGYDTTDITYLKVIRDGTQFFRAVFILDVSHSMFSGPCPESVDILIPDVNSVINCFGPSGVDPDGHRYQILLTWLRTLQNKIEEGIVQNDQIKVKIIPFSGTDRYRWWSVAVNKQFLTEKLGGSFEDDFLPINQIVKQVQFLWALENDYHKNPQPSTEWIPTEIQKLPYDEHLVSSANLLPSAGTSMPSQAMEDLNNSLWNQFQALTALGTQVIEQTHFEIIFFSDGMPKPHPEHIKSLANFIWQVKHSVFDYTRNDCGIVSSDNCTFWLNNVNARNCITDCVQYLEQYANTASVRIADADIPTCQLREMYGRCIQWSDGRTALWRSPLKCRECFNLLYQFQCGVGGVMDEVDGRGGVCYQPSPDDDQFKSKIFEYWGNWTLNRTSHLMELLKMTKNIFQKQYSGVKWKINFLELDSEYSSYKLSPGEKTEDINWVEAAKKIFPKGVRFVHVTRGEVPFSLFSELEREQEFVLGKIYAIHRNLAASGTKQWIPDSDGDGLADSVEISLSTDPLKERSNDECLDSLKSRLGQCVALGCSKDSDNDGDGLNQCEERTIGADEFDADSDGDSLLDFFEAIFNLNPQSINNFSQRAHEKYYPVTSQLIDYKTITEGNKTYRIPGYFVKVENIVWVPTLEVKGSHGANENLFDVYVRVDNLSDIQDSFWLKKTYVLNKETPLLKISFDEFTRLEVKDPQ